MKELELYKFIKDNNIEYHWYDKEIYMMVNLGDLEDFHKILPKGIFDDEGLNCTMKDGYVCFEMIDICEYCGINPEDVFEKEV